MSTRDTWPRNKHGIPVWPEPPHPPAPERRAEPTWRADSCGSRWGYDTREDAEHRARGKRSVWLCSACDLWHVSGPPGARYKPR